MATKLFLVIALSSFHNFFEVAGQENITFVRVNGTWCPCHFDTYPNPKDYPGNITDRKCVGIFPFRAGMATDNQTVDKLEGTMEPEDATPADKSDDWDKAFVAKACSYYGKNVSVLHFEKDFDKDGDWGKTLKEKLPTGSVFFVEEGGEKKCAYVGYKDGTSSNAEEDREIKMQDCKELLKDGKDGKVTYVEYALCTTPSAREFKPLCKCPCGFVYGKSSESCNGVVTGCQPFEEIAGMLLLSQSVLPTVALIARVGESEKEPPEDWPNGTAFFVGDPGDSICGYKNATAGGKLEKRKCKDLFKEFSFFSVLTYAPSEVSEKECKIAPLECGRARPPTMASWYTLLLVWMVTVAIADDQ